MGDKQQLRFAFAALAAGLAWGFLRNRQARRPLAAALIQGIEWFVAYGGAAALVALARELIDDDEQDEDVGDRVTHIRRVVTERTGTEG